MSVVGVPRRIRTGPMAGFGDVAFTTSTLKRRRLCRTSLSNRTPPRNYSSARRKGRWRARLTIIDLFNAAATLQSMRADAGVPNSTRPGLPITATRSAPRRLFQLRRFPQREPRPHRRHQRLPGKHPAEAGLRAALHQSRPRARGHGQIGAAVNEWMKLVAAVGCHRRYGCAQADRDHQAGRVLEGHNQDSTAEDVLKQSLDIESGFRCRGSA